MAVRISVSQDGARVRVEVSTRDGSCVDVDVASAGVRIVVGSGLDGMSLRIGSRKRSGGGGSKGSRGAIGGRPVSPEMEAAAVRAFLGAADATRLGRSLAAVYLAMDAIRRDQESSDEDDDDP